ncbi:SRPBCC family protein [Devosia sediminis]|uniref:SRPBCC domain-containing protein n=1 Tax=Devosia sediminis TaxID=2798801 RepID=A0A934J0L3_9HYPH|nr:SRPBCC domain-containing protein [Devosia sediminis]MBJ3786716.1 SRPBCC domain-containing protein [Devosia sediminis]
MSEKSDARQVVVDITIAAPIEAVWEALRDPKLIKTWFGWDAPSLADEIKFIFIDHATPDEARRVVQFGEWEGSSDAIELTQTGGGTRLRLMRSGGAPLDWDGVYEDIREGWVNFFQQLRLALELHEGEGRRTIYLSGAAKPGVGEPSAELGLDGPIAYKAGRPYTASLAPGLNARGLVWYTTHYQTGLVVEQFGNGLIVVSDMGVSPKRPNGGGSVLITTYGLSDSEFATLETQWKGWWDERYGKAEE